jgi:hypothetical protein
MKHLMLLLAFICILLFVSPLYIVMFDGPDLMNTNPLIFIGFGVLSIIFLSIHKKIKENEEK